eukprot:scaffold34530_cov129-Isochrysis_galbana.AAC.2
MESETVNESARASETNWMVYVLHAACLFSIAPIQRCTWLQHHGPWRHPSSGRYARPPIRSPSCLKKRRGARARKTANATASAAAAGTSTRSAARDPDQASTCRPSAPDSAYPIPSPSPVGSARRAGATPAAPAGPALG